MDLGESTAAGRGAFILLLRRHVADPLQERPVKHECTAGVVEHGTASYTISTNMRVRISDSWRRA
jgi:hypothetical protein